MLQLCRPYRCRSGGRPATLWSESSRDGEAALQTFALQGRISGVFIILVWGMIPNRLFRNTADDDSG